MKKLDFDDEITKITYTTALLECLRDEINSIQDDALAIKDADQSKKELYYRQLFFNVIDHANQLDALAITSINQLKERIKNLDAILIDLNSKQASDKKAGAK